MSEQTTNLLTNAETTSGEATHSTDTNSSGADANRGISAVSGDGTARRKNLWPLVVAALLLLAAMLGFIFWWQSHQAEKTNKDVPKGNASSKSALASAKRADGDDSKRSLGADGDSEPQSMDEPLQTKGRKPTVPAIERDMNGGAGAAPIPVQGQQSGQPGQATPPRSRFDAPSSFNATTGYGSANPMPVQSSRNAYSATNATNSQRADYSVQPMQTQFAAQQMDKSALNLTTTKTPTAQASMIGNRDLILPKGAFVDCDLDTAINSTVPGMVRCTTTKDAYSDNGRVVLIGRGSTVTGEYRSDVQNGQARIQIIWNRIKTPEGAVIEPASPASDGLGRGGADGEVDNHWGERIGSAFLLSTIKDAIAYKTATNGNGSTTTANYQNTQQSGDQMATQILKQTINIPPTITRNQGTRVKIFLARDLDFSSVYTLKVVAP